MPSIPVPALPAELERDIFEMTTQIQPDSAARLVLVARRVQIWIEPIMYQIVVLDEEFPSRSKLFLRTICSKPASFFAQHVKHLCLKHDILDDADVEMILSACSGVTNFAHWLWDASPQLLRLINQLNLERLSINTTHFFTQLVHTFEINRPLFVHLTHLDLFDIDGPWENMEDLARIPKLSHLSFNHFVLPDVLKFVLVNCNNLRIVALQTYTDSEYEYLELDEIRDFRVVDVVYSNDTEEWRSGACGEFNFWTRAEEIVVKRLEEYGFRKFQVPAR